MGLILKSVGALLPHYSGRKVRVVMSPPLMSAFEHIMGEMRGCDPLTKASNDAKVQGRRILGLERARIDFVIRKDGKVIDKGVESPIVIATLEGGDEVMLWIPVQN